jgi:DsbC/DsbD-like thiol-disulfide interchange protein
LGGDVPGSEAGEFRTRAFVLRTSQSNRAAAPGQRITLVLDFEVLPKMHAYAPGAAGYRALELRLEPGSLVTLHETVFPPSRPYHFAPLKETVPVFSGRFRVTRDVSLAGGREMAEALKAPEPRLEIRGTLEYQACSDVVCYPPASVPLSFTVDLLPLDRERSPKAAPAP